MAARSSPNPVTLAVIAKKTGLSPSTVSVVLNGKARERKIARTTEERVLAAVRGLKYQPNFFASQLRRSASNLLMICVQQFHDLHSSGTAEAFVRRAAQRGYHVLLSALLDQPDSIGSSDAILGPQGAVGLAVVGSAADRLCGDSLKRWLDRGVRVVSIEWRIEDPRVSHVLTDEVAGGRLAADHVYQQGVKEVWALAGNQRYPFIDRVRGYQLAAATAGAPQPRLFWVVEDQDDWADQGYRLIQQALSEPGTPRPEALLGVGGMLTVAGVQALTEQGLAIGRDVAVVSYHSGPLGRYFSPTLTTVDPSVKEAGEAAADLLIDLLEGKAEPGVERTFRPSLTVRESGRWGKSRRPSSA